MFYCLFVVQLQHTYNTRMCVCVYACIWSKVKVNSVDTKFNKISWDFFIKFDEKFNLNWHEVSETK